MLDTLKKIAATETAGQFLRFGMIGTAGFVVDASVLHFVMEGIGLDPYSGRAVSWLVAVSFTWAMNRRFTFLDKRPPFRQWLAFLGANAFGGAVNYAVYAALVTFVPLTESWSFAHPTRIMGTPMLGVAAGAIAGLFFNFTASKLVVFRRTRPSAI